MASAYPSSRENEVADFAILHKTDKNNKLECKATIGGELLQEVRELKYLDIVLCKHSTMEGEI